MMTSTTDDIDNEQQAEPRPAAEVEISPVLERPFVHEVAHARVWPIFLFRALALQGTHPTIAKGIDDHSTVFNDPEARTKRTLSYATRLYLDDDVPGTAAEIRELHRTIKGIGYDGRPYHAWSPDVWAWVHLTTQEAMLYALSVSFWPLPEAKIEALYQAGRQTGRLYGVRDQDMPADVKGLRAYIDAGIKEKLARSPGTDRLKQLFFELGIHVPAWIHAPARIERVADRMTNQRMHILAFGSFPPAVRKMWGIRWTRVNQAEYLALLATMRAITAPLPDRLRMLPVAYDALRAAG